MHKSDMKGRRHQMSDQQDRQIGRSIIRLMMQEFLATFRAGIVHLEIAVQQLSFAAVGALATKTPKK